MRKGATNKKDEDSHRLVLKGNSKLYYHQKAIVNFAPVVETKGFVHPQMKDMVQPKSTLPTFNADKLYYTSGFVLPSQQRDILTYLSKHNSKMQQYEQINEQQIVILSLPQLVPKPKDRHYCHVCGFNFEDYCEVGFILCSIYTRNATFQPQRIKRMCKKFHRKNNIKIKYAKENDCSDLEESLSQNSEKENKAIHQCS